MSKGIYAIDFDCTLAIYYPGMFPMVGEPIQPMVDRVKRWLKAGRDVVIFTARASEKDPEELEEQVSLIENWCEKHIGQKLPVTSDKSYQIVEFWDDRAKQVIPNTGITLEEEYKAFKYLVMDLIDELEQSGNFSVTDNTFDRLMKAGVI